MDKFYKEVNFVRASTSSEHAHPTSVKTHIRAILGAKY